MTDELIFSRDDWARIIEAVDRITARRGRWHAKFLLIGHLYRGELGSADLCFVPGKGFKEILEPISPEYWQSDALTKLEFALQEVPKPKGYGTINTEAGAESTIYLDRACLTYVSRHQLDRLYPPPQAESESLKSEMVRAILKGPYPNGYAHVRPADALRLAKTGWNAECANRHIDPKDLPPPSRSIVDAVLGRGRSR